MYELNMNFKMLKSMILQQYSFLPTRADDQRFRSIFDYSQKLIVILNGSELRGRNPSPMLLQLNRIEYRPSKSAVVGSIPTGSTKIRYSLTEACLVNLLSFNFFTVSSLRLFLGEQYACVAYVSKAPKETGANPVASTLP